MVIFVSMTPKVHKAYIASMALIVIITLIYLAYIGYSYYNTSLEERFYHPEYETFKPSGSIGHGLGIFGSLAMLLGVSFYMMRKRIRSMARLGKLKHWLEFHIFLCTMGPVMVLFHTSFKFGGLVSISFWSMVAVFLSGIIGRFIYIRIPRSIEGRELSLGEIGSLKTDLGHILKTNYSLDQNRIEPILQSIQTESVPGNSNIRVRFFRNYLEDQTKVRRVKAALKENKLSRIERSGIVKLVKNEISINRKIAGLQTMQNLFKYWHVAHLPFAIIMLIIMVIHVAVTIIFGYRWIL